jgi:hypothetical protein
MHNLAFISLFILFFSARGCKHEIIDNSAEAKNIKLPVYSETGAGTLGCLVDGKVFTVFGLIDTNTHYGSLSKYAPSTVQASIQKRSYIPDTILTIEGTLGIITQNVFTTRQTVKIEVAKKGNLKGVYNDFRGPWIGITYSDDLSLALVGVYRWDARKPATLTINKDEISNGRHIISGKFEGYLYSIYNDMNHHTIDSVKITNGVFDVDIQK